LKLLAKLNKFSPYSSGSKMSIKYALRNLAITLAFIFLLMHPVPTFADDDTEKAVLGSVLGAIIVEGVKELNNPQETLPLHPPQEGHPQQQTLPPEFIETENRRIEEIQTALTKTGLYTDAIDGIADERTIVAIEKWESRFGQVVDGNLTDSEFDLLKTAAAGGFSNQAEYDAAQKEGFSTRKNYQDYLNAENTARDTENTARMNAEETIRQEAKRYRAEGHPVSSEYGPEDAIRATINGKADALAEGRYYVRGGANLRSMLDNYGSMMLWNSSNYKVSQVLDDYILYQNTANDLPPILLEREPGKLYLQGQNIAHAAPLFEYVGTMSYESIVGAPTQALVFRPIRNKKFEDALEFFEKKK